ncbi:cytochrome oxidase putative small subunit CydP [Brachymonas denitrificans]|nr:cytochrome oxidase putative small subunit CydP [Brachymonas denitrificans]
MSDSSLVRHLIWVVLIKLALLTAIWWSFFRSERVQADAGSTAAHVLVSPSSSGASQ